MRKQNYANYEKGILPIKPLEIGMKIILGY